MLEHTRRVGVLLLLDQDARFHDRCLRAIATGLFRLVHARGCRGKVAAIERVEKVALQDHGMRCVFLFSLLTPQHCAGPELLCDDLVLRGTRLSQARFDVRVVLHGARGLTELHIDDD